MRLARSFAVAWGFAVASCGYGAVYGRGAGEAGRLHVKLVRSLVADVVASDEVAQGVREELARFGALEGGEGYPRVEVEVTRDDESSEGLADTAAGALAPVARGTSVSLLARGWVVPEQGAPGERDTGDLRTEDLIAVDESAGALDPRASTFHQADALRSSARRLGRAIARRVMGMPAGGQAEQER